MKFNWKTCFFSLVVLILSLQCSWAQNINPTKSKVQFTVDKLGFSSVTGTFSGMKGYINFDPNNLSSSEFQVCIDATTVKTDEPDRDEHLRASDFFNVKKYPKICFKSKSMLKTNAGYLCTGTLTIKGKSKSVNLFFNYTNKVFSGKMSVNRKDFNLSDNTGTFLIGEMVDVEIKCLIE